jgi:hypothetical protein
VLAYERVSASGERIAVVLNFGADGAEVSGALIARPGLSTLLDRQEEVLSGSMLRPREGRMVKMQT